jgi:hypothetical protein
MECRVETKYNYYSKLADYWMEHGFPILNIETLPERLFVIQNNGKDLYCVPVYITDSSMAWIGFPTSNPKATKKEKEGALEILISHVEDILHINNYTHIITTSATKPLMEKFRKCDFVLAEENVNFYTKQI